MALVVSKQEVEYAIKPEAVAPLLDTSSWPLLLRNYDKRTKVAFITQCFQHTNTYL